MQKLPKMPYFDRIFVEIENKNTPLGHMFTNHVHWGYWKELDGPDLSLEGVDTATDALIVQLFAMSKLAVASLAAVDRDPNRLEAFLTGDAGMIRWSFAVIVTALVISTVTLFFRMGFGNHDSRKVCSWRAKSQRPAASIASASTTRWPARSTMKNLVSLRRPICRRIMSSNYGSFSVAMA